MFLFFVKVVFFGFPAMFCKNFETEVHGTKVHILNFRISFCCVYLSLTYDWPLVAKKKKRVWNKMRINLYHIFRFIQTVKHKSLICLLLQIALLYQKSKANLLHVVTWSHTNLWCQIISIGCWNVKFQSVII